MKKSSPHNVVVSAQERGSEGCGFKFHQSRVGLFISNRLLPRVGTAMGPRGRLRSHTRASSTSRRRLWGCCFGCFTNIAGAAVLGPSSKRDMYDSKRGLRSCQVISNWTYLHSNIGYHPHPQSSLHNIKTGISLRGSSCHVLVVTPVSAFLQRAWGSSDQSYVRVHIGRLMEGHSRYLLSGRTLTH